MKIIDEEVWLLTAIIKMRKGADLTFDDLTNFTKFLNTATINLVGSDPNVGMQVYENFRLSLQRMLEMTKNAGQKQQQ